MKTAAIATSLLRRCDRRLCVVGNNMNLLLRRTTYTENSTSGELFVNGAFQCFTLEDVRRDPGVKVYGKTAIPAGKYALELTYSNRFKKIMPQVMNVPMFEGIRIHSGNTSADTEGCLLVGSSRSKDFVGSSRVAFACLFPILEKAANDGEKITIEIVDTK